MRVQNAVRLLTVAGVTLVFAGLSAGCGTVGRATTAGGVIGGVIGGGAGAALGMVTGDPVKGAVIGATAGAAVGAAVGHDHGVRAARGDAFRRAQAAAAAPQESCSWAYDHTGQYVWKCAGHVGPRPALGVPQMDLPAPERLTPAPAGSLVPSPPPPVLLPQAYAVEQPMVVYVRRAAPRYYYGGHWRHYRPARVHVLFRARF